MKGRPRLRRLAVDASFDHKTGAAGIAVGTPGSGGQAFIFEVAMLGDVNVAEAMAIARGIRWLEEHEAPRGSTIYSDSRNVVMALRGCPTGRLVELDTIREIRETAVGNDWHIALGDRLMTKPAHKAAQFALRTWLAGRSGVPTLPEPNGLQLLIGWGTS